MKYFAKYWVKFAIRGQYFANTESKFAKYLG